MKSRGFSLIELMLSMGLMAAVMTIALTTWFSLDHARAAQHQTVDARQQVRNLTSQVSADIASASFIYYGYADVICAGTADQHDFSTQPVPMPGASGNTLIYAIPEAPYNPTAMTYTIVAVWSEPDNEPGTPVPAAGGNGGLASPSPVTVSPPATPLGPLHVNMNRFEGVKAPASLQPGGWSAAPIAIDLRSMSYSSKTVKLYTPSILAPDATQGIANLFTLSDPATSVTIDASFQKFITRDAPPEMEHLFTRVTYRIQ